MTKDLYSLYKHRLFENKIDLKSYLASIYSGSPVKSFLNFIYGLYMGILALIVSRNFLIKVRAYIDRRRALHSTDR